MVFIVPLVLIIMMFAAVVAFGAVTVAITATATAMKIVSHTPASRGIRWTVIGAGILGFAYSWIKVGPINEKGVELVVTVAIKITVCLFSAAGILLICAIALKIAAALIAHKFVSERGANSTLYVATAIGIIAGFFTLHLIEQNYHNLNIKAANQAIELYTEATEPTHCVYAGVRIYSKQHQMGNEIMMLPKGEKVRLNSNSWKVGNLGDTQYLMDGKIVYGRGVFVRMESDGTCVTSR